MIINVLFFLLRDIISYSKILDILVHTEFTSLVQLDPGNMYVGKCNIITLLYVKETVNLKRQGTITFSMFYNSNDKLDNIKIND